MSSEAPSQPSASDALTDLGLRPDGDSSTGIGVWVRDGERDRTIVLLHGIGLASETWVPVLSRLPPERPVLAVDLPGHGLSPCPPAEWGLPEVADMVAHVTAQRSDGAVVVGISMGGMVAEHVAVRHPELARGLVLGDCLREQTPQRRAGLLERAQQASGSGMGPLVEPALERWFSPAFRQSNPKAVGRVRQALAGADPVAHAWASRALAEHDLGPELVHIAAPTVVLCGELDVSTPPPLARLVAETIPGARFEPIADAGHLSALEAPDVWARAIKEVVGRAW